MAGGESHTPLYRKEVRAVTGRVKKLSNAEGGEAQEAVY